MEKFEFKSAICTSIEQSKRLLELGLKKETADMVHQSIGTTPFNVWDKQEIEDNFYPAWSLGRLIKDLMPQSIGHLELAVGSDYAGYYDEDKYNSELGMYWEYAEETPDMFDNIISTIKWLIKKGYFNKDYLKEKK